MKYLYAVLGVLVVGFLVYLYTLPTVQKPSHASADYKTINYTIDGKPVALGTNGSAYFGNELKKDLNGDGKEDVAFLITSQPGGSGTFYYLVGAVATTSGYVGTNAVLLGDRIAPQTTESGSGDSVIVNYADRNAGEPFTTKPSVGKSALYILQSLTWVPVTPEGLDVGNESGTGIKGTVMLGPTCPVMRNPPDPQCADKPFATSLAVTSVDGKHVIKTFSSDEGGTFFLDLDPGTYALRQASAINTLPRCSAENFTVISGSYTTVAVSCDTGIR